ncbi:uncharacterized protein RCC_08898 [Ramularia collo-cygni]|uniref:USP domain-containing protein n=1 Tax=Ramularia collo-cygni TaxID=112498 RepID=A0A2D3VN95_9PEZI|nr:uncharacterized protein RCC_08898 [Ramularia collo-cygni]CZT23188.1 uncharacterized protein RCC_08898 [Ramularia collo-cygni]
MATSKESRAEKGDVRSARPFESRVQPDTPRPELEGTAGTNVSPGDAISPGDAMKSQNERGGRQKRLRDDEESDHTDFRQKKQKAKLPKGLRNIASACFSNACLQLVNAVFTPAQVAQLAGDSEIENFGLDVHALRGLEGKNLDRTLDALKGAIKKSSPVRIAPYVGKLLEDLRSDEGSTADPVLLQRAFAFGKTCYTHEHELFSGDSQEDASEYLRLLISSVGEEQGFVDEAFRYHTAEATVCMAPSCEYRNEHSTNSSTILEAQIPPASTASLERHAPRQRSRTSPVATLDSVLEAHFDNAMCEGSTCGKCNAKDSLAAQLRMTEYPDHLLVSINRTRFESAASSAIKDTTKIKLNFGDIRLGKEGVCYRLIGLVKHFGKRADDGHYSAYVKISDGNWASLDDDAVKMVPKRALEDGVKGYSSILLLQR